MDDRPTLDEIAEAPTTLSSIRSNRENSAHLARPEDVIRDAAKELKQDPNYQACVIIMIGPGSRPGSTKTFWTQASPSIHTTLGMLTDAIYSIQRAATDE